MKKFAVVLSGSGVFDGSEIHEATLTMYAIRKAGADYQVFAPDIPQHHVINHLTGEEMPEKRNVLVESARIARGNVKPLDAFDPKSFDVLVLPGGFGAAKNLSSYAFDGTECHIEPSVEKAVMGMHQAGKPIAALCISPVLIARILGDVELTIGQDQATRQAVEKLGATHKPTDHGEVIVDRKHKVYTTPCYMLDADIAQIGLGAENLVQVMLADLS